MKQRIIVNVPGGYRTDEVGNGMYEVRKCADAFLMTPDRRKTKKRGHIAEASTIAAGFIAGVGLGGFVEFPPMIALFIAGVAWCVFLYVRGRL